MNNENSKMNTKEQAEDLMHEIRIKQAQMRKTERKLAIAVMKTTIRQFFKGWATLIVLLPLIALIAGALVKVCVYAFNFTFNLF